MALIMMNGLIKTRIKENSMSKELMLPIARTGEPIYASIVRNRSGVDSGEIDYGCRVFDIEELSGSDKQSICDTAYALYRSICQCTGKRTSIQPPGEVTAGEAYGLANYMPEPTDKTIPDPKELIRQP